MQQAHADKRGDAHDEPSDEREAALASVSCDDESETAIAKTAQWAILDSNQ